MAPIVYRQLLPVGDPIEAQTLLASLPQERASAPGWRPHVVVNFIASADGRVTVGGRSTQLGDEGDRELFRALRERADAVLAGTNTMAAERYGRMLPQIERRQRRRAAGRVDEPLAVLISRSGALPLEIPLFAEPEATVVVFSPTAPDLRDAAATVHHELLPPGGPSLTTLALRVLRERYGVETLLCEGGPTLFSVLLSQQLADELFLTIAPKLAGPAGAGTIVAPNPPLDGLTALRLLGVLERDGSLYLRYGVDHTIA